MIKTTLRALTCALFAVLPLTATTAASAETLPLEAAITSLPVATENRAGYQRTSFRHWIDEDKDTCTTRMEVLIAESRTAPVIEAGCRIVSGTWYSYYDGVILTAPGGLDVDHMVPLAEAWDSGASTWTAQRRQDYANDLTTETSLVAVTAKTNRSKADQDPAQWLPPLADARCTYVTQWVATKLRWALSVDETELQALRGLAEGCGQESVAYDPATS